MQAWRGRTAAAQTAVKTASTWDKWCTCQRRPLGSEHARQHDNDSSPFSERELAHLSFVRWLHQTGHLDPASTTTTERNGV
jgi:hypothetical protein